ncbi:hypothetical protein ERJ75_001847100 [Trypanosoma vivax]|nr:hypothetical protein ERJ75_001847100 [Trypanosoma vivax]
MQRDRRDGGIAKAGRDTWRAEREQRALSASTRQRRHATQNRGRKQGKRGVKRDAARTEAVHRGRDKQATKRMTDETLRRRGAFAKRLSAPSEENTGRGVENAAPREHASDGRTRETVNIGLKREGQEKRETGEEGRGDHSEEGTGAQKPNWRSRGEKRMRDKRWSDVRVCAWTMVNGHTRTVNPANARDKECWRTECDLFWGRQGRNSGCG